MRLVSGHLLYTPGEPVGTKDPPDGDGLEEAAPQDGDAARAVKVHELEDEGAALGDHGHAEEEEEDADEGGEGATTGPEEPGEDVDQAGHEALHDAELAVNADRLKEKEKIIKKR